MTVRVLVVDSSPETVGLARQALVDLDCDVSPATSISLALFLAHKNPPDLIVSGLEMTDGGGLELLAEVKADRELQEIPFIFLAAGGGPVEGRALAAGAEQFLTLPVRPDVLLGRLKPFLRERRVSRPPQSPE